MRTLFLALLMAAALHGCTDTRTAVCLNGVRCPAGLMCVEPHGYCALPEDVEPCLSKPENVRCEYRGYDVGICRRGVCELDDCEDSVDCNDGNNCTRDTCVGERCVYEPLDGVSCNDNDFCNGADTCVAGECTGHSGDPCTRGNTYCDPELNACVGCTTSSDCPESIFGEWSDCTGAAGTCSQDGVQTRTAITFTCDGAGVCQMNQGTETRVCMRSTDGEFCSDGNLCTANDRCTGGVCGGQAVTCDDGNECTAGMCNPELECQHTPVAFGTACGYGHCDGLGSCVTCDNVGQACGTANPCERGEIRCVGGAPVCIPVGPAAAGTVCSPAAGACDLPEVCNGADNVCPTDRYQQGTICHPAVDTCDVEETCSGTSASCPSDTLRASGEVCREAAGACDIPATCTGTDPVCPENILRGAEFTCRESAGPCDVAETCTGASAACPDNAFLPPTRICRESVGGCDVAETCTGTDAACPDDVLHAPGTPCRDPVNGCDIREECDGSSVSCPADVTRCSSDEYCFVSDCFPRPTIDFQGTDDGGEHCADLGIAHPEPGFISRVIFEGRAGAPFRYLRRHVSCPGSCFAAAPVNCRETPEVRDEVLPQGGTCTYDLSNNTPDIACPLTLAGRWEVYVVVDDVAASNIDVAHIYNSNPELDCFDPPPTDCASAFSFCPCTGACNAAECPSSGECSSLPSECDAGAFADTRTGFSMVEEAE